ncbi:MAG: hypothetical protein IJB86_03905 [Clostridia bacterium]|nr:hypothetical protein [Clostridia bacterium]
MRYLKKQELWQSFAKLIEKIKKDKKSLIIVTVCVVIITGLLLSELSASGTEKPPQEQKEEAVYEQELEKRLTELISTIDGAGEAKVMITLKNGEESVFAKNSGMESDEGDAQRLQSEQEYVILKSGSEESGLKLKTVYPEVSGVAVVCHGAESPYVRQRIISTVTAVLGISSAKVSVVKMKSEGN